MGGLHAPILLLFIVYPLCISSQVTLNSMNAVIDLKPLNNKNPNKKNSKPISSVQPPSKASTPSKPSKSNHPPPNPPQKHGHTLTLIGYASDPKPARHLQSFSKTYNLDFHLIGTDRPWGGFNDKIKGFSEHIRSIDNTHNESLILILDAYDTVPLCNAHDLISKFLSMNTDIVISTGKDCWPDPNVEYVLMDSLSDAQKEKYKSFLPWFLCPNSGAIMGRHDAMLFMFERVQQLVHIGNGSCNDFEGNRFSTNTQSDQRCYTTYYVELLKYNQMYAERDNTRAVHDNGVVDISLLDHDHVDEQYNPDVYISSHFKELERYYKDITMKLDHENELFISMGGMMFMDLVMDVQSKSNISFRSKITNGSACIMHGNGPGMILFRSFVRQIEHDGKLYVTDWVLRIGTDFFHWILWWAIMPMERLSHWFQVHLSIDPIGMHSTTFSEEVVWRWHIWAVVGIILVSAIPIGLWYKYKFTVNRRQNTMSRAHTNLRTNNQAITQQFLHRLSSLEIRIASTAEKND
eukprot:14992_1